MITVPQLIGIIIAIVLTGILVMIGYQIYLILQELRESMRKVNKMLDETNKVVESVADPVVSLSGFFTGLKDGAKILHLFRMFSGKNSKHDKSK